MQKFRHPLFLTLALLVVAGCECNPGPGPRTALPDYVATPTLLSFEACPSQDETGAAVADVFPAVQTLTVENIGQVSGALSVTIQGRDAALFQVVESSVVESIGSNESVELQVQFSPKAPGDVSAELVIDDGSEETEPVKVVLEGSGSSLAAQPKIKISYQLKDTGDFDDCLESFNGSIDNCQVLWPDTYKEQISTLKMKIQNLGCPTLKVTGVELLPFNEGEDIQFVLDKPSPAPSVPNPALLSLADGTQELELEVRFEPRDNGTQDPQRYAYMKVSSNSVTSPESMIMLYGAAAEPSLYTTPTFCDYTNPNDTCNGTKVPTSGLNAKSVFQITNGGNTDITIESVAFRKSQTRFAIGGANPQGTVIAPAQSAPLEILYTDAPLFVTELIDIKGTSAGMPTNTATIRLQGGVLPCLYTEPDLQLDFSDTTGKAEKPIQICNRAMDSQGNSCGDLNIVNLQVSQGLQFFKVKAPAPVNTTLSAGNCATATLEFTPPVTGGTQAGTLDITTNDPDYTPKRLMLYSDKPTDYVPEAVIKGPAGETPAMSVKLSEINPKRIDIHGEESFDPPNNAAVTQYKFYLVPPNGAVVPVDADLIDSAGVSVHNKLTPQGVVSLVFNTTKTGLYTVYLTVYDSANQASTTKQLQIDVRQ